MTRSHGWSYPAYWSLCFIVAKANNHFDLWLCELPTKSFSAFDLPAGSCRSESVIKECFMVLAIVSIPSEHSQTEIEIETSELRTLSTSVVAIHYQDSY